MYLATVVDFIAKAKVLLDIHIVACFPSSLYTEQIPLLRVGGHFSVDQMGFDMDRTYRRWLVSQAA